MLGEDCEDLGAGEGTALGGKASVGRRGLAGTKGPRTPSSAPFPVVTTSLAAVRAPGVTSWLLEAVLLLAVIPEAAGQTPDPHTSQIIQVFPLHFCSFAGSPK